MNQSLEFIRGLCLIVSVALLAGVLLIRWFQRTQDDPKVLVKKLFYTLLLGLFLWKAADKLGIKGYAAGDGTSSAAALLPFVAVIFAILFSIIWTPSIGGWLAGLITGELDGGNEPPDPKPYYSIARGLWARGKYAEAVAEIQQQLEKFPDDYEGQMLLAEIQAKSLNALPDAETTVQNLCEQPGHSPQNVAAALTTLADWHLKLARDREAAQRILQQIIGLFPDSDISTAAAQRLAHLGDAEMFRPPAERQKYPVPEGIKNFGLRQEKDLLKPHETSPEELAAQYVKHLEQHPLDTEAREKLATIYAEHYQRLDMAANQLESLIANPNQPVRQVVRWLNLLADLHIRCASDYEAAKACLQQILNRFPNVAAAETAKNRLELLRLEIKGKEKSQAVRLGSYEQNVGLRTGLPR
jgi:TolA-binding protein